MAWTHPGGARLPGLSPIEKDKWLIQDDAFNTQMAYRDQLIRTKKSAVYQILPSATDSAEELRDTLVADLSAKPDYRLSGTRLTRPDGVTIETDTGEPLLIAGQLAQEDFALLTKGQGEHRLTGATICFPANWRLADKIGKTLSALHAPVRSFDTNIAARTQRVFCNLRTDTLLERANFLIYTDPDLHQPQRAPKTIEKNVPRYIRVERQTLRRLPKTGAIVFAIHTYQVLASTLSARQHAGLAVLRPEVLES